MNNKIFNILINFNDNSSISSDPIRIVKGDYNSIEFDFTLDKNDYEIATLYIVKPSGSHYVVNLDNAKKVVFSESNAFDEVGDYAYRVALYDSDSRLTVSSSAQFKVVDGNFPSDDEVESESQYPVLDQLINRVVGGNGVEAGENVSITDKYQFTSLGAENVYKLVGGNYVLVVDGTIYNSNTNYYSDNAGTVITLEDMISRHYVVLIKVISAVDTTYNNATTTTAGLMSATDKSKLDGLVNLYKFKGTVATIDDLPNNASVGDTYDVTSNGHNYAWTENGWDDLGGTFPKATATNDGLMSKEDKQKLDDLYDTDAERYIKNFFNTHRDHGRYETRFPKFATSQSCVGTKLYDNALFSITMGTDTTPTVDTYVENRPIHTSFDVNAYVDSNGVRRISAIKGDGLYQDKFIVGMAKIPDVFVCEATRYWKYDDSGDDEYFGYTYDKDIAEKYGYVVDCRAINKDGSISPYVLTPKYIGVEANGELHSLKDLQPCCYPYTTIRPSYNAIVTAAKARGTYYSGGLLSDYMYLVMDQYIRMATKNHDTYGKGCTDYNVQCNATVAESGASRVIVSSTNAAKFDVNTYINLGSGTDRNAVANFNIANHAKILSKTEYDSSNVALNLDVENVDITTSTYVSTIHEKSGFSDYILGSFGSIGSNTNGRHGFVWNKIETLYGGYEIPGNAAMKVIDSETSSRNILFTNDATKITTSTASITSNYEQSSIVIPGFSASGWKYITKMGFDVRKGVFGPVEAGASGAGSATGYSDAYYGGHGTGNVGDFREAPLFGSLWHGANAGLACLSGSNGLGTAHWSLLGRLSINAVGGELS